MGMGKGVVTSLVLTKQTPRKWRLRGGNSQSSNERLRLWRKRREVYPPSQPMEVILPIIPPQPLLSEKMKRKQGLHLEGRMRSVTNKTEILGTKIKIMLCYTFTNCVLTFIFCFCACLHPSLLAYGAYILWILRKGQQETPSYHRLRINLGHRNVVTTILVALSWILMPI